LRGGEPVAQRRGQRLERLLTDDGEAHARERGIRWFAIPSDRATLARALEQAIGVQS
jgi:hypothetical protein